MKYYFASQTNYNKIIPYQQNHDPRNYIIVSKYPIVALLSSIKIRHIPLFITNINENIYIIEYIKNSLNLFKNSTFLYEIEWTDKVYKEDWNNVAKYEFEIRSEPEFSNKIKIDNVYNYFKKSKQIKLIKQHTFMKFINQYIPKQKYTIQSSEKQYLYHGSPTNINDSYLKPHDDGNSKKPYLYVSCLKTAALKFAVKGLSNVVKWGEKRNYIWFLEIIPKLFDSFKKDGYLYYVNHNKFKLRVYPEYISSKKVPIIKKTLINNIYDEMKQQPNIIMIKYDKFKQFLKNI